MISRLLVVFGLVMFAPAFGNTESWQVRAEQIDGKKAEQVDRAIRRAIFGFAFQGLKISYGLAEYTKGGRDLVISDVVWKNDKEPGKAIEIKKIIIENYKEDLNEGDYSFDKSTFVGIDHVNESKNAPTKGVITAYSVFGVKGSEKTHSVTIDKVQMSASGPQQPEITFEIAEVKLTNIKKLQESFYEAITFKALNGTNDPAKILAVFEDLNNNLNIKKVQVSNVVNMNPKSGQTAVAAGKMIINEFSVGHIGEFLVEDMKLFAPGTATKIGKIDRVSLRDIRILDIIKFGKLAQENPGLKPTPERVSAILKWMSGMTVKGFDIKTPDGEFSGDYDLNWGKYVGLYPTEITLKVKGSAPLPPEKLINPNSPTAELQQKVLDLIKEQGIDKIEGEFDIKIAWDEKSQSLVLRPFFYDINKLYSMSFTASIGNISKAVLQETDPKKLGVLFLGTTVGPITLEVEDKGLQVFYEKLGKGSIEKLRAGVTIPELQPLFEDVVKLVNAPNGKLKIVVKPKSTVGIAHLAGAIAVSPLAIISLFDVTSEYSK